MLDTYLSSGEGLSRERRGSKMKEKWTVRGIEKGHGYIEVLRMVFPYGEVDIYIYQIEDQSRNILWGGWLGQKTKQTKKPNPGRTDLREPRKLVFIVLLISASFQSEFCVTCNEK